MNWDQIEGNWKQLKGKAVEKWGEISDDEMDVIAGKKDQLVGKLQARYGVTLEEAEKEVNDFSNDCKSYYNRFSDSLFKTLKQQ